MFLSSPVAILTFSIMYPGLSPLFLTRPFPTPSFLITCFHPFLGFLSWLYGQLCSAAYEFSGPGSCMRKNMFYCFFELGSPHTIFQQISFFFTDGKKNPILYVYHSFPTHSSVDSRLGRPHFFCCCYDKYTKHGLKLHLSGPFPHPSKDYSQVSIFFS